LGNYWVDAEVNLRDWLLGGYWYRLGVALCHGPLAFSEPRPGAKSIFGWVLPSGG
jgi:hypothetical protein